MAWARNPLTALAASGVELYEALDVGGCPYLGIPMKQPDSNHGMDFAFQAGQQPRLLTKSEVAAYAQCTTRCIDNWMRRGYLPYFKIGRTVRFKVADVVDNGEGFAALGGGSVDFDYRVPPFDHHGKLRLRHGANLSGICQEKNEKLDFRPKSWWRRREFNPWVA